MILVIQRSHEHRSDLLGREEILTRFHGRAQQSHRLHANIGIRVAHKVDESSVHPIGPDHGVQMLSKLFAVKGLQVMPPDLIIGPINAPERETHCFWHVVSIPKEVDNLVYVIRVLFDMNLKLIDQPELLPVPKLAVSVPNLTDN